MAKDMASVDDVIKEMELLLEGIPPRPSPQAIEEARLSIRDEDRALTSRLAELFQQKCPSSVPASVFSALQEMHETVIRTQSDVRKRDNLFLLQLEERHRLFDDLRRTAELARPVKSAKSDHSENQADVSKDDGRLRRSLSGPQAGIQEPVRGALGVKVEEGAVDAGGLAARTREEGQALFASQQPRQARPEAGSPLPQGSEAAAALPLTAEEEEMLQSRWPPDFLDILETAEKEGKQPESLNYSNGGYNWIPDSIGVLVNLKSLKLSGNQLTAVPDTIGALTGLTELDLESNHLKFLPDSIGELVSLRKLNLEKNSIEEIPFTIGGCTSLVELRADFNRLKALPEALGQLKELQFLSVHLNELKSVPTTMSSLTSLTDLFINFNHLETIPESLCSLTGLTRLDASSNFAEFRHLPAHIGNLQGLRDLDLSFNHITVLPDSFTMLTNLRVLKLEGNPWRNPPLEVVAEGKDAIFEYMVQWKQRQLEGAKKKKSSGNILSLVANFIGRCTTQNSSTEDKFGKISA